MLPTLRREKVNIDDIQAILERMLDRTNTLIASGRRADILNERFFHHMFSWEVGQLWQAANGQSGQDMWHDLFLAPEAKTNLRFRRKEIRLGDSVATRENAVGTGRRGNLDFVLKTAPLICVEWKGPKLYTASSAFEVFLKLLNQSPDSVKVFAAFITSSTSDRLGHLETARRYLDMALTDAREHKQITTLSSENIYGFIASFAGSKLHRIQWGPFD
jgi:hypothetical protein